MSNGIFLEALKLIQQILRKPWIHFSQEETQIVQNAYQAFFRIIHNPSLEKEMAEFFKKNFEIFDQTIKNFRKQYEVLGEAYQQNLQLLSNFLIDLQQVSVKFIG